MTYTPSNIGVAQRMVVSVGDYKVTNDRNIILSTFGLGSCLGVIAYEKKLCIGGMLHLMLPDSTLSPEKAEHRPGMFADTGIKILLEKIEAAGGDIKDVNMVLVGGASSLNKQDVFKIGEKNLSSVRKLLSEYGVEPLAEEIGGVNNRNAFFSLKNGNLEIKELQSVKTLSLK